MANNLSTRKLFSIASVIFLFSMNPCDAKWTLVSNGYLGSIYLDFATLKKHKNTVTAWQLQNLSKADLYGVWSRRLLVEVDCLKDIRRIMYLSSHSEQMAKGKVIFVNGRTSSWEQPLPKSLAEKSHNAICEKNYE